MRITQTQKERSREEEQAPSYNVIVQEADNLEAKVELTDAFFLKCYFL